MSTFSKTSFEKLIFVSINKQCSEWNTPQKSVYFITFTQNSYSQTKGLRSYWQLCHSHSAHSDNVNMLMLRR